MFTKLLNASPLTRTVLMPTPDVQFLSVEKVNKKWSFLMDITADVVTTSYDDYSWYRATILCRNNSCGKGERWKPQIKKVRFFHEIYNRLELASIHNKFRLCLHKRQSIWRTITVKPTNRLESYARNCIGASFMYLVFRLASGGEWFQDSRKCHRESRNCERR